MTLDDLKALQSEINEHRRIAERIKRQAESLSELRRRPDYQPLRVRLDEPNSIGHGVDTARGSAHDCDLKDETFSRVWRKHGRDLIRLAEMDLNHQQRDHLIAAQQKQARLDALLAGAGEVEPQ